MLKEQPRTMVYICIYVCVCVAVDFTFIEYNHYSHDVNVDVLFSTSTYTIVTSIFSVVTSTSPR